MAGSTRRLPGALNLSAAVVMLAFVLVLAVRAVNQSPPAIAEFAPQAQQQIRTAPQEQSASFGRGPGGAGPGSAPSPLPTPSPDLTKSILRHCVGDPPRQTEDPQSPPCVAFWSGTNNGGHTSHGVDAHTINIAVPTECGQGSTDGANYDDLKTFFNLRFEFYGRQVSFICGQAGIGESPEQQQKTDADKLATQHDLFASTHYRAADGFYYVPQMACVHHVVVIAGGYFPNGQAYLNQCRPYIWQYVMDADTEFASEGRWICARLAGQKASHSPGSDSSVPPRPFNSEVRKFGVIFQPYYTEDRTNPDTLLNELRACNVNIPEGDVIRNPITNPDSAPGVPVDPTTSDNAILHMKQDNVSSVICLCNLFSFGALQKSASNQNYYPEWIASTYGPNDIAAGYQLGSNPPDQRANTFGVTFTPRAIRPQEDPYYMAIKEVHPGANLGGNADAVQNMEENYRPLLVLMSGIQMAGPDLTPETFQAGLQRTVFPNPDTPIRAGHVGFAGGSRSMTIDGAEWWYSNNAAGPYSDSNSGTICYVEDGVRRTADQWPRGGDPFFSSNCDGIA